MTSREVAALALPSVAVLRCGLQTGSGFFVTEHRLLTNEHVTCGRNGVMALELAETDSSGVVSPCSSSAPISRPAFPAPLLGRAVAARGILGRRVGVVGTGLRF